MNAAPIPASLGNSKTLQSFRKPVSRSCMPVCCSKSVSRVEAPVEPHGEGVLMRRALLLSAASALMLPLVPLQAQAIAYKTLCVNAETEDEDTECRRETLARDAAKQETYGDVSTRKFELAPNVPVSLLNDEYVVATLKLTDQIQLYCTLDVYAKERVQLIKSIKTDSAAWVSKYARGGSVRSQSARKMYIAVDSVAGHLASNGLAPLPPVKVKSVLKTIGEATDFLSKGL